MELTPKQQALELINKAKHILIAPGRPDGDSVGSAIALHLVLNRLNKKVDTVVLDPMSEVFKFLPAIDQFKTEFKGTQDFIISLDCSRSSAEKLSYNTKDGKLNIVITPKENSFKPEDVSFSEGSFPFDLIITLDAADFDQVGMLYEKNPKLFQSIPVINIDHHASNDYYGTVNLVDLTATSTAEILVGLIEALGPSLIDEDVATALLAGIINDTGSFQHSNTTPKSLTIAAQMVGFGARQQEIIKYFFKTKQFPTLKLWGKILSNIQHDEVHKLVWSTVSYQDMQEVSASAEHVGGIIDELMTSVPEAEVIILLSEREANVISGSVRTKKGVDASEIAKIFGGGGHHGAAGFKLLDTSIIEAESTVITKIRDYRLNQNKPVNEPTPVGVDATSAPGADNINPPLDRIS